MEKKEVAVEKKQYKDVLGRTVAMLGLVAIILLGAWGIIQIVFNLSGFLSGVSSHVSSLFEGSANNTNTSSPTALESVSVHAPDTAVSGEAFTLSWTHNNKGSGNYQYLISYSCTDGLSIKAPAPNASLQSVPCSTPFNYTNAVTQMELTPTVKGSKQLRTVVTVSAISLSTGAVAAYSTSTLTVLPAGSKVTANVSVVKKTTSTSTTRRYAETISAGVPDLATVINSVTPIGNTLTVLHFTIQNVGSATVRSGWTFNAQLPVGYAYTYVSAPQGALAPGERVEFTLTFSRANLGGYTPTYNTGCNSKQPYQYQQYQYQNQQYPYQTYSAPGQYQNNQYAPSVPYQNCSTYTQSTYSTSMAVTITADPDNRVAESNENNNEASAPVAENAYTYTPPVYNPYNPTSPTYMCPNGTVVSYASQCPTNQQVYCTEEARLCPDGVTYVGRTGSNCSFAPCP